MGAYKKIVESPLLIRWFAMNLDFHHENVEALPVGLKNNDKDVHGISQPVNFAHLLDDITPVYQPEYPTSRLTLSYISFYPKTSAPERLKAVNALQNISKILGRRRFSMDYAKDVMTSKFTVSPPGFSLDNYRTWEAVLLGSIPIVLDSPHMRDIYDK